MSLLARKLTFVERLPLHPSFESETWHQMNGDPTTAGIWEFLRDDVVVWGLASPMLSWVGSGAILLFFIWHVGWFLREVSRTQASYGQVWPMLTTLARERKPLEEEWFWLKDLLSAKKHSRNPAQQPIRVDLDDVRALDVEMKKEALFQRPWLQFRKTFIVEHVSWFIEPRVFSTRQAGEFFPQESVLSSRLNLAFYHQLPSLITGIGLLLTFLAILIGLSKLHAEGSHIVGIQGLINGLAGKFLTSIIGLVCANVFVLLEKSFLFRLTTTHQDFLDLLDELFPRKTMEQMLEDFAPLTSQDWGAKPHPTSDWGPRLTETITDRLGPSVQALTTAAQALAKRTPDPSHAVSPTAMSTELAQAIQENLAVPMKDLKESVRELTVALGNFKVHPAPSRAQDDIPPKQADNEPIHSPLASTGGTWKDGSFGMKRWWKRHVGEISEREMEKDSSVDVAQYALATNRTRQWMKYW